MRKYNNHMSLNEAAKRGLTLSEWCAHEQAEDALDELEAKRIERVIFGLLCAIVALCLVAAWSMGA